MNTTGGRMAKVSGRGFTLIELLVVIAIIALILSVVIASITSSKNKSADLEVKKALSEVALKAEGTEIAPGVVDYQTAFTTTNGQAAISALATKFGIASDQYDYSVAQDGYAIVFPLKNGKYYCIDSTNTTTEVTGLLNTTGPKTCANATRVATGSGGVGGGLGGAFVCPYGCAGLYPFGIAIDHSGNIYTANNTNNTVSKITQAGVRTVLGTTGVGPRDIVIDSQGNLFTANYGGGVSSSNGSVTKITPAGVSSVFATIGTYPTNNPWVMTIDSADNIYVAYQGSGTITKITPAGVVSTFATTSSPGAQKLYIDPATGNMYAALYWYHKIDKITPAGVVSTVAALNYPGGIVMDATGNMYVTQPQNNRVSKVAPDGTISTFATMSAGSQPYSIVRDPSGNLFVANQLNNTITKITPSGTTSAYATSDGTPTNLAFDAAYNLYSVNYSYHNISKYLPH